MLPLRPPSASAGPALSSPLPSRTPTNWPGTCNVGYAALGPASSEEGVARLSDAHGLQTGTAIADPEEAV